MFGRALSNTDWRCIAYCLMSNHLHFAMVAGERDLQSWAKKVNAPFAQWLNKEHSRLGPVFADRPSVYTVVKDREAQVIAYIHNNPVRAGVVRRASDSMWSSHPAYVGRAPRPPWLHVDEGLQRSGFAGDPASFDNFVDDDLSATFTPPNLVAARAAIRKRGAFEVGTPTLSDPVEFPILARPFVRIRPSVETLVDAVTARVGVSSSAAARKGARGATSVAKRIAIHASVELGVPISDVSASLNVSRQRGSKVARTPLSEEEHAIMSEIVGAMRVG